MVLHNISAMLSMQTSCSRCHELLRDTAASVCYSEKLSVVLFSPQARFCKHRGVHVTVRVGDQAVFPNTRPWLIQCFVQQGFIKTMWQIIIMPCIIENLTQHSKTKDTLRSSIRPVQFGLVMLLKAFIQGIRHCLHLVQLSSAGPQQTLNIITEDRLSFN